MVTLGGKLSGYRHPSNRGRLIVDTWRGKLRVRSWPRKATAEERSKAADQHEWFRQANTLAKYAAPQDQLIARALSEGTPLMPRDLFLAAMAGRFIQQVEIDGQRYYSMAARQDVSELLDILGYQPGAMLLRQPEGWEVILPGPDGYLLTSEGVDQPPRWLPPPAGGGGGGGPWQLAFEQEIASSTPGVVVPDLPQARCLRVVGLQLQASTAGQRSVQYSHDGGQTIHEDPAGYAYFEDASTNLVTPPQPAFYASGSATTSTRSIIFEIDQADSDGPKRFHAPTRNRHYILPAGPPITGLRIINATGSAAPDGNLTAGRVEVWVR